VFGCVLAVGVSGLTGWVFVFSGGLVPVLVVG
jgi:hypothetical protein